MKIDEHRAKARNIERSLLRCTLDDYETVIEGCMLAGTHHFNILLHDRGSPLEQDVMHAEFLSVAVRRKSRVMMPGVLEALDEIERFRTSYVRGDLPGGTQAAQRALECLDVLRSAAHQRI